MANIAITSDAWTEISITSGTVQNISATADIELSAEQTDNSGVVLKPSEIYQWDNETIYARAVTEDTGALRVVNFKRATGGGGGYVLPVATSSTLGGVKVGNNLSIDASGVLSANAGGYTLPPATTSTLGGVIVGDNITVDANGEISVAAPYSLPKAAAGTLGGVKVGTNLSIDGDGVLSADSYTLPAATANDLGGVKIGSNVNVDANGVISVAAPYTLPTATANDLGGVKIGSNITIDGNGAISAPAAYTLPTAAANTLGGIKVGSGLSIDASGVLSATGGGSSDYAPVGRVVFDVVLRDGYIKANGATVADASTSVPNLLQFVQDNSATLLAADAAAYAANVGLYLYDSGTDALTLPNYIGRVMQGGNSVESVEAGLPNLKGEVSAAFLTFAELSPLVKNGVYSSMIHQSSPKPATGNAGGYFDGLLFDASQSNSIYSDSVTTVQPPAINMIPQIKY